MTDRAAGAPRVEAMLDRLGDRLGDERDPPAHGPQSAPRPLRSRTGEPPRVASPRSRGGGADAALAEGFEDSSRAEPTVPPERHSTSESRAFPPGARNADPNDVERSRATVDAAPSDARTPAFVEMSEREGDVRDARAGANELGEAPSEVSGLAEPSLPAAEAVADPFAEFESADLPADSTHVEDRDLLADESTNLLGETAPRPILFVESGRDAGREFTLQDGETSVGRGIDNDVILTDVSVSRKHLRILVDENGITLIDLGSGNGTMLNGRRVHRALVGDGDRIEIGETVLVARIPGAKPELHLQATQAAPLDSTNDEQLPSDDVQAPCSPWPTPYPSHAGGPRMSLEPTPARGTTILLGRGTLVAGAAALVVVASMTGAMAMAWLIRTEPRERVVGVALPPPVPPLAPAATPAAAPTSPELEPTSPSTHGPSPSPAAVPSTLSASASPSFDAPSSPVPSIAVGAPTASAVERALASANPPTVPDPGAASRPAEPSSLSASAGSTTSVQSPAQEAIDRSRPVTGPSQDRTARAPAGAPSSPGADAPRSTREPRTRSTTTATTLARPSSDEPDPRILAAYRRGDFVAAAQYARSQAEASSGPRRAQLEQLARNIDTVGRRMPEARRGVFAAVEEAHRLDRRIAPPDGAFGADLTPRLAAGYLARARSTMSSQPVDACGDVRAAMTLAPASADARALFRDCENRAMRLFAEAQRLERSDPTRARLAYGDVVSMLGNAHPTARDAAARLVAMGRTPSASPARPRHVDEDE